MSTAQDIIAADIKILEAERTALLAELKTHDGQSSDLEGAIPAELRGIFARFSPRQCVELLRSRITSLNAGSMESARTLLELIFDTFKVIYANTPHGRLEARCIDVTQRLLFAQAALVELNDKYEVPADRRRLS